MTRAERLHYLLEEINNNKSKSLLNIWMELFDVSNIFEVYDRLIYVKKEIDLFDVEIKLLGLDNNEQFKNIISILNTIVEYPSLNSSISNYDFIQSPKIELTFSTFNMFKTFEEAKHISPEKEEDIPHDEFILFKKNIDNIIDEIETSNMLESDKLIFLSIFHDLNKGMSLYKINGLNAFIEVLKDNFCKIKMISNIDDSNEKNVKFKTLTKKIIGKIWVWTITYMKKRTIGLIDSNVAKYLDDKASEWAELPTTNFNDVEDTEIEE